MAQYLCLPELGLINPLIPAARFVYGRVLPLQVQLRSEVVSQNLSIDLREVASAASIRYLRVCRESLGTEL